MSRAEGPRARLPAVLAAVLAALALLLSTAHPCAGHGFLVVDLGVAPSDGGLVVTVATDRHEFALALVRAGLLSAEEFPAPTDDQAFATLAARFAALAAQRLACSAEDGAELSPRCEAQIDGGVLRLVLRFPDARTGVRVRLGLHPGHAPPAVYRIRFADGEPRIAHEGDRVDLAAPAPADSTATVVGRYLTQGFLHVLPWGLDHLLFVLGLSLLGGRPRRLLGLVTGFTLAHALTLSLVATGVLPTAAHAWIIEALIAASLIAVAIEATCPRDAQGGGATMRSYALVVCFGLVHGCGFASALRELGLPKGELLAALVAFNLGIEAAQLALIAGAWLLIGWARERTWYRRGVVWPASAAIAGCGAYLLILRLA
ncbi:MAG: HupE/UreJ family protein [Planctomycetes bacterium]|nr:HupE/UreJ family protein [Planctomycetota bacterium]